MPKVKQTYSPNPSILQVQSKPASQERIPRQFFSFTGNLGLTGLAHYRFHADR